MVSPVFAIEEIPNKSLLAIFQDDKSVVLRAKNSPPSHLSPGVTPEFRPSEISGAPNLKVDRLRPKLTAAISFNGADSSSLPSGSR